MNRPNLLTLASRKSSILHYQTFPTNPPTSKGKPPTVQRESDHVSSEEDGTPTPTQDTYTPLPKRQLMVLAVIALAEQTAFNSLSPYLPKMASTFPEVDVGQVGMYVGLIASSFAAAQFVTNFFWGWLSDRVGRKPVILTGTLLSAACFLAFGFCKTLWQAILVQTLLGLVNGNQGVFSTCLGEITDQSNQARAFKYLPAIYGAGAITGPAVGGLLVDKSDMSKYPFLGPNLFAAGALLVEFVLTLFFLEETLEGAKSFPSLRKRAGTLISKSQQLFRSTKHHILNGAPQRKQQGMNGDSRASHDVPRTGDSDGNQPVHSPTSTVASLFPTAQNEQLTTKDVFNRDTVLLLVTFLIFQLSNIAYNSLYPIFGQAQPPTGRDLSPREIGLTLAFAGVISIVFQVGVFEKSKDKYGSRKMYASSHIGLMLAFGLMPWISYKGNDNDIDATRKKILLWIELGLILILKTVAAIGGLTSALLLVNTPPNFPFLIAQLTQYPDYKLSVEQIRSRGFEWIGADFSCCWPRGRALHIWYPFLAGNPYQTERGSVAIWYFRWCIFHWVCVEHGHTTDQSG